MSHRSADSIIELVVGAMRRGSGHPRTCAKRDLIRALVVGDVPFVGPYRGGALGAEAFYSLACRYNASAAAAFEKATGRRPYWWREGASRFRLSAGACVRLDDPDGARRGYRLASFSADDEFANFAPDPGCNEKVRGTRQRVRMSRDELLAETKRRDDAHKAKARP